MWHRKRKMWRAAACGVALLGLAAPVGALDMMVWDGELQTKLAYGQTGAGEKLRGEVLQGAGGPVVVLFSLSDAEKNHRAFAGLQARYEGVIKGDKLLLKLPSGLQSLEQFLAERGLELELRPVKPKPASKAPDGQLPAGDGPALPAEGQLSSGMLSRDMNALLQLGLFQGGR